MKTTNSQANAISYRPKRAALNWVDYLVIAATIATFATVVAVNNPHAARAQTRSSVIPRRSCRSRADRSTRTRA